MTEEIKYQAIWGKGYILLGVLFGLLFIFGGLLLEDYTVFFNLIASFIVIYMGYSMLKRPYATYNENEITVFGFMGSVRKHYQITDDKQIDVQKNRIYLAGEKLKINGWMVDKKDWVRFLTFYDLEAGFIDELKE